MGYDGQIHGNGQLRWLPPITKSMSGLSAPCGSCKMTVTCKGTECEIGGTECCFSCPERDNCTGKLKCSDERFLKGCQSET